MRSDIAILATKSVALREIDRIMVTGDSTAHLQQENEEEVEVVTKKGNWESVAIRLNGESRYVFLPPFKVLCFALLCFPWVKYYIQFSFKLHNSFKLTH